MLKNAGVAQLVEQLICNQQVGGSSPSTSSIFSVLLMSEKLNMGEFPSGQRGQTVNLLLSASMVRIHPLPPELSPEKAQSTKTLEISRVFAIFTVNFVAKTQGTKLAAFLIPPDSNRRKL